MVYMVSYEISRVGIVFVDAENKTEALAKALKADCENVFDFDNRASETEIRFFEAEETNNQHSADIK